MTTVSLKTAALILVLSVLVCGCSGHKANLVANGDRPAFAAMLADLKTARVIFVGEFHDKSEHHALQMEIIKALHASGKKLAIGMEMFDLESQPALDQWVSGGLSLPDFVTRYQQSWGISWIQYDRILLFSRNQKVPLIALDAPGEIVRKVSRYSFSALQGEDFSRLPPDVTVSQSASYKAFMRDAFADHQLPESLFNNFCQAQALRNSTMALTIRRYLAKNPDSTMIVITGVGHAMRRAAAQGVAAKGDLTTKIVVPLMEGMLDVMEDDDADYFVTP